MKKQKATIKLFSLLFLCFTIQAFGQKEKNKINVPFDSTTQKYTYVKVVEIPNKTATEIYKLAKDWTKSKYADDKYLIDSENEQLIDQGNFTINVIMNAGAVKVPYLFTVIFNLNFLFKEGKCKFEISNIKLSQNAQGTTREFTLEGFQKQMESRGMGKKMAEGFVIDVFHEIDVNTLKLISEIETGLKDGTKSKSDW